MTGMERLQSNQIRLVSFLDDGQASELPQLSRKETYSIAQSDSTSNATAPYVALSYCWGTERRDIRVDGETVSIPTNLADVLPHLRRHLPHSLFWIDSLSINQSDLQEKTQQVSMMDRIFAFADKVIVWLGTDAQVTLNGFDAPISVLAVRAAQMRKQQRVDILMNLSKIEWFYRAWTLQEIRLASNAFVICGQQLFQWDNFISNIAALRQLEPKLYTNEIRSQPASLSRFSYVPQDRFFFSFNELSDNRNLDLADLLFLTWYRDASEKRDKVFSLLGPWLHRQRQLGISVDYQVPWSSLCIKAARACINTSCHLKILRIAGMIRRWKSHNSGRWDPNERQQLLGHPSWAPDWWAPPQQTRSRPSLQFDDRLAFRQLDFCCPPVATEQNLDDTSPFLSLTGVLLGIINMDESPTLRGGRPLVHSPPRCAGFGNGCFSSNTTPPVHVPRVDMSYFTDAVQSHLEGDCSCFPFRDRQNTFSSPFSPSGSQPPPKRFNTFSSFPIFDFPRPGDVSEEDFPAQVLAASVESGDWLVLLQGGGMPFLLRPLVDLHGRISKVHEFDGFSHREAPLPDDAGCFVLVGEASMCWNKLWPNQWDIYCRAGNFVII